MLAVNFDDVQYKITPLIGQPKLNGFHAYWDGEELASRQQKIWMESKLPHIYDKLRLFSAHNPGVLLDGELYTHGMARQEISKRVSGSFRHLDYRDIDFHAFDIIDFELSAEDRQIKLLQTGYEPFVPCCRIEKITEVDVWMPRFLEAGFEGMMLRDPQSKYVSGRSEGLIKLKPWQTLTGVVVRAYEGEGKYRGMAGALEIKAGNVVFKVSGGLKDLDRRVVWENRVKLAGHPVVVKYRELSNAGKPLEPQLAAFTFNP